MKKIFIILFIFLSISSFAQENNTDKNDSTIEMKTANPISKEEFLDKFGKTGLIICCDKNGIYDDGIPIKNVILNSPSDKVDIQKDDIIIAIDNAFVKKLSVKDAISKLGGAVESIVKLLIYRPINKTQIEVEIKRDLIPIMHPMKYKFEFE